jgi:hypothetical protein
VHSANGRRPPDACSHARSERISFLRFGSGGRP